MRIRVRLVEGLDVLRQPLKGIERVRDRARHVGGRRLRAVDRAGGTDCRAGIRSRECARDGLDRHAVLVRAGTRLADADADGGVHLVHGRAHLAREDRERLAHRGGESAADRQVLVGAALERRSDFGGLKRLAVDLREERKVALAEAAAAVEPPSPRKRVVVLDVDHARTRRRDDGLHLRRPVGLERGVERALFVVLALAAKGVLDRREVGDVANGRRAPPSHFDAVRRDQPRDLADLTPHLGVEVGRKRRIHDLVEAGTGDEEAAEPRLRAYLTQVPRRLLDGTAAPHHRHNGFHRLRRAGR